MKCLETESYIKRGVKSHVSFRSGFVIVVNESYSVKINSVTMCIRRNLYAIHDDKDKVA